MTRAGGDPGLSSSLASGSEYVQLSNWSVCQICGRCESRKDALRDGWLVSPYVPDKRYHVVRCFRHISEWSLRMSGKGRTARWRKKMLYGRYRGKCEFRRFDGIGFDINSVIFPVPLHDYDPEEAPDFAF